MNAVFDPWAELKNLESPLTAAKTAKTAKTASPPKTSQEHGETA